MKHLKNSLVVFAGVLAVTGAVTLFIPSFTHGQPSDGATKKPEDVRVMNSPSEPVPVAGTINVGNVVQFRPAVPMGAFSVMVDRITPVSGPDAAGTSYAITSVTMDNITSDGRTGKLFGRWVDTNDCFSFGTSEEAFAPLVTVPAGETVHLAFPQPFILTARPGAASCLIAVADTGVRLSVVGYRF